MNAIVDQTDATAAASDGERSEETLRSFFEQAPLGYQALDQNGNLIDVNQTWLELLGYEEKADVVGRWFGDFLIPCDQKRFSQRFSDFEAADEIHGVQYQMVRRDGTQISVAFDGRIVRHEDGRFRRSLCIVHDITSRELAEDTLKLSHQFLMIANRSADKNELLQTLVKETQRFTGCAAVGIRLLDDDGRIPYQAYVGFCPSFYASESPLSIHTNRCMCINVISATTDVSLSFYTEGGSFFSNSTTSLRATATDEERGPTRNACDRAGYESVALIPIRFADRIIGLIHVADPRQDMVPARLVYLLEEVAVHLGTAIERLGAKEALRQAHDELEGRVERRTEALQAVNVALQKEITQRNTVEEALRKEQQQYHDLVEIIPYGVHEIDSRGIITFANAMSHRIFDREEGDLVGHAVWEVVDPESERDRLCKYHRSVIEDQPKPSPYFRQHRTRDGQLIDTRVDWDYKRGSGGEITGFVAVMTDITEQRRAEEEAQRRLDQLAHVSRLSTMGEMVSGLAHELNQPLAAIANYARTCRHQMSGTATTNRGEVLDSIQRIVEQAHRAGKIIRHLREFVRRVETGRVEVDINDLVRDIVVLLDVQTRLHDVSLELILDDSLPEVHVDRIQIEQVITNLVANAMEATQEVPKGERKVTVRTSPAPKGRLTVSIEDTGKEVQKAEIDQWFEPFYTTKNEGMGLGLAISRSIIGTHGGHLEALPNGDRGAVFHFTLPARNEEKVELHDK